MDHPGLVRLFGLVEQSSDNPAMLVMEHGANGSLYNYLHSSQEISWRVRLRLAEELAQGLAYLHKKKVVHRDIKSLNVVLDRHNHAKWCDFGLATLKLHTLTTSNAVKESAVGTLHWMAPELFYRKTSSPSTASDIWALGMLFFELASRKIPFSTAANDKVIIDWIKNGDVEEVPDDCQRECPTLASMMQRCWVERAARPTAAVIAEGLNAGDQASADTFKTPNQSSQVPASSGFVPFSHR